MATRCVAVWHATSPNNGRSATSVTATAPTSCSAGNGPAVAGQGSAASARLRKTARFSVLRPRVPFKGRRDVRGQEPSPDEHPPSESPA